MVTYKETHANAKIDPLPDVWTGTWRDSRPFNPEGPKPENALKGTIFTVNAWRNDPLIVPARFAALRFWRNTEVAQLKPGQQAVLGYGILGHEWNEDLDNGFRPAGLMRLSETTVNNVPYIQDFGTVYDAGTATHHLTLFRAPSGALVFSAGTRAVGVGPRPNHDTETGIPPERATGSNIRIGVDLKGPVRAIQQATMNLFADMGVQPTTRQEGLVRGGGVNRQDAAGLAGRWRRRASGRRTARSKSPAPRPTAAASSRASRCRSTAARRGTRRTGPTRWRYRFEAAAAPARARFSAARWTTAEISKLAGNGGDGGDGFERRN